MKFKTMSGTIYEVDWVSKKVRRLSGTADPTLRQGKDGEWKAFDHMRVCVGECTLIQWDPETTPLLDGNGIGIPATLTSKVIEIISDDIL
jgi:hypothetical protein